MEKLFGTDGIRGLANQDPISPEIGVRLGRAAVRFCKGEGKSPVVVIGRDTRASGEMLECAVVSGILSEGGKAQKVGVLPTPAVAYLTKEYKGGMGVVISASHNPHQYNGFKVFSGQGRKLSDRAESRIESLMFSLHPPPPGTPPERPGQTEEVHLAHERYLSFLRGTLPHGQTFYDLQVVLDCANGATSRLAPALFEGLGAGIEVINAFPDGTNINEDCGSEHTGPLCQKVLETGAHLGLAFDGDGDRLIAVEERGRVLTGDHILAVCAKMLKERGELETPLVVSTVMSNLGFRFALEALGLKHMSTRVGDRYVMEAMRARNACLGGEDSGHIIFLHHHTTGDGLLTGLQLLLAMKTFGEPLSKLSSIMTPFPQARINVPVKMKHDIDAVPEVARTIKKVEKSLGTRGRVLVRYSGTEAVCRVMVEGENNEKVDAHCREIAEVIRKNLGHSNSSDSSAG